jgi:hypothetical protein
MQAQIVAKSVKQRHGWVVSMNSRRVTVDIQKYRLRNSLRTEYVNSSAEAVWRRRNSGERLEFGSGQFERCRDDIFLQMFW